MQSPIAQQSLQNLAEMWATNFIYWISISRIEAPVVLFVRAHNVITDLLDGGSPILLCGPRPMHTRGGGPYERLKDAEIYEPRFHRFTAANFVPDKYRIFASTN